MGRLCMYTGTPVAAPEPRLDLLCWMEDLATWQCGPNVHAEVDTSRHAGSGEDCAARLPQRLWRRRRRVWGGRRQRGAGGVACFDGI